jgi:hypothetical protein
MIHMGWKPFLASAVKRFKSMNPALATLTMSVLATAAHAKDNAQFPVEFQHKDWQLVCDNTRTCRAAGYWIGDGDNPVSILLTRDAGPNTPVSMQIRYEPDKEQLTAKTVELRVGKTSLKGVPLDAKLSAQQVATLLRWIPDNESIEISQGKIESSLSLAGAKAVLTKMDAVQGRVGTPSALVAKGNSTQAPLPAVPVPVIQAVRVVNEPAVDNVLARAVIAAVKLPVTPPQEACVAKDASFSTVQRLSLSHLLVTQNPCWSGAYNSANRYWVVDVAPPHRAMQIDDDTLQEFEPASGTLRGFQKGRGLGDCVSLSQWVWDGQAFIKASEKTTGLCRGFLGGAWDLPTHRARVIPAPKS